MTRERLISLFLFQQPHVIRYRYRGKMDDYKQDLPILNQLIAEGLVKLLEKNAKTVTFQWVGETGLKSK